MSRGNPWEAAGWHALRRETSLVQQLIGSGATALGRANYADKAGEYYNAFFGLSVGIERLAKLVLVIDSAIQSNGQLPNQKMIKAYGHKLLKLMDEVDAVRARHSLQVDHVRPTDSISKSVIDCLDAFADAKGGRYANFQALGDPNFETEFEPIRKWWADVAGQILQKHYANTEKERRVNANAELSHTLFSDFSSVLHFNEAGEVMQDIRTASARTGQTEVVQQFGRYYALLNVRWLACIHQAISDLACYGRRLDAFFGHAEYLATYRVDDKFLKTRKIWPL
jgi:hypothetical protein